MKKLIILSITAIMFILGACHSSPVKNEPANNNATSQIFNLDTTKLKSGEIFYQCEMDPEVISDKPGKCPKCGMDLEKSEKK